MSMFSMRPDVTYYLAGPMSGVPKFNFPLFESATRALRERGLTIISPAELDDPAVASAAHASANGALDADGKVGGYTWGAMLGRDVQVVADECDGIILLPRWSVSRGARLEAYTGVLCGHVFGHYVPSQRAALPYSANSVRRMLARELIR